MPPLFFDMNIKTFINSAFKKSLAMMGSEEIIIGETKLQAVHDEQISNNPLGLAAKYEERNLIVKFPSSFYSGKLKSGMFVTARGQKWQISSDDGGIIRGDVSTTLTLIEPERTRE